MNIFFYASSRSDTGKRCLKDLLRFPALKKMTNLSGESLFLSPLSLKLRSGDLIILFAVNTKGLNELVALRNELNNFRIVLILAENDDDTIRTAHLLQPRFVTFIEDKMDNLQAVIQKMTDIRTI